MGSSVPIHPKRSFAERRRTFPGGRDVARRRFAKPSGVLALSLLLIGVSQAASAAVFVASADQDTWLKEAAPDANNTDVLMNAMNRPGDNMRVVCRFDLSSVPPGSIVSGATVRFDVKDADISGAPINVYRITGSWTEFGATWNNTASEYDSTMVYGSFTPTTIGPIAADITALVQEWVDGVSPNYGLMLIPTSDDIVSKYASRDWGTPSERPRLDITTAGVADLALMKVVDDPTSEVGQTITYTITVTNNGPDAATGVEVLDLLPPGVTYQSSSPSVGTYNSLTGLWGLGSIANGSIATLLILATID